MALTQLLLLLHILIPTVQPCTHVRSCKLCSQIGVKVVSSQQSLLNVVLLVFY
uniref:Uncharacterized protein n=1 Tax=Anguilla anguilla TaxID=7936 RepID=A0A0E9TNR2_ANGAN